jgi:hypothetical protein
VDATERGAYGVKAEAQREGEDRVTLLRMDNSSMTKRVIPNPTYHSSKLLHDSNAAHVAHLRISEVKQNGEDVWFS